ncbi:MAG: chemotaxis-specific protein-glutamate methyltransferase CheB [Pseudomonadota bacterium]
MIRVLLVDDSPVVRAVLKKMLCATGEIEVVGQAGDGREALDLIPRTRPQVILTDLRMPGMDGLALVREVMNTSPLPILVVSGMVEADRNSQTTFELLEAGAIDVFPKPAGGFKDADRKMARQLISKVKILRGVIPITRRGGSSAAPGPESYPPRLAFPANRGEPRIAVIGASTGGPQALAAILASLPAEFPVPLVCVQHISPGFIQEMISWLNHQTSLTVKTALPGEVPRPGGVYFPPERRHLGFDPSGAFKIQDGPEDEPHRPSVDVTFNSTAAFFGDKALGVLLTGMGRDGAAGLLAIHRAGGMTIAQDEGTSVVFGMPREAIQLGAAKLVLPLPEIAGTLVKLTRPVGAPAF